MFLDDVSDCVFSFLVSHRDMLAFKLVPFIKKLKEELSIAVKIILCGNAGEICLLMRHVSGKGSILNQNVR